MHRREVQVILQREGAVEVGRAHPVVGDDDHFRLAPERPHGSLEWREIATGQIQHTRLGIGDLMIAVHADAITRPQEAVAPRLKRRGGGGGEGNELEGPLHGGKQIHVFVLL